MSRERAMLERCRAQFAYYVQQHTAKTVPPAPPLTDKAREDTLAKAAANQAFVDEIDDLLASPEGDITLVERVQDYRFANMTKSGNWAYAKGLTINPSHLPAALKAMEDDDWILQAIFGDADANKIGFIFRRAEPHFSVFERVHGFGPPLELEGVVKAAVDERMEQFKAGKPLGEIG